MPGGKARQVGVLNERRIAFATHDLAVAHGHNQHAAIGQKPKSRGLARHFGNGLQRAIEGNGQDPLRVKV